MKRWNMIVSIAVVLGSACIGFTMGSHRRAINRLMMETRRLHTADSLLLEGIKSVDSLQWRSDSLLMDAYLLLNERINEIKR